MLKQHYSLPQKPDTPDIDDLIYGGQDEKQTQSEK